MSKNKSFVLKIIQYYLISGLIEAVAALVYLVRIPSDPKNAWILGISKNRLVMLIGIVSLVLLFLVLSILAYRKRDGAWLEKLSTRLEKWIKEYRWYLPLTILAFGYVFFKTYFYLLEHTTNLTTFSTLLIRISPFVYQGWSRTLQTVLVLSILNFHWKRRSFDQTEDKIVLAITPKKVLIVLLTIALLLVSASISMDVIEQITWERVPFWGPNFDLDREFNFPTYFSSLILFFSSALSWLVSRLNPRDERAKSYRGHWVGLSILFLLLSIDEFAMLHEHLGGRVRDIIDTTQLFDFRVWVFATIPLFILFAIFYIRFYLQLPKETKRFLALAAILYVGGAIGLELLGGWYEDANSKRKAMYQVLTTIEETMEMVGIILYIDTLLKYLGANTSKVVMSLNERGKQGQDIE